MKNKEARKRRKREGNKRDGRKERREAKGERMGS